MEDAVSALRWCSELPHILLGLLVRSLPIPHDATRAAVALLVFAAAGILLTLPLRVVSLRDHLHRTSLGERPRPVVAVVVRSSQVVGWAVTMLWWWFGVAGVPQRWRTSAISPPTEWGWDTLRIGPWPLLPTPGQSSSDHAREVWAPFCVALGCAIVAFALHRLALRWRTKRGRPVSQSGATVNVLGVLLIFAAGGYALVLGPA